MNCPSCGKPMVRFVVNLTTGRELWKCRHCSLETEVVRNTRGIWIEQPHYTLTKCDISIGTEPTQEQIKEV